MTDYEIIELYFCRDETAIKETHDKYGNYLFVIANNILRHYQDSEECVSDTYYQAWNHIPPKRPNLLRCFLANIIRNLAINKYEYNYADKRNKGKSTILDEIDSMIPQNEGIEDDVVFQNWINQFLSTLSKEQRMIFVQRYYYCYNISDIANYHQCSITKIKSVLFRLRKKLKQYQLKV